MPEKFRYRVNSGPWVEAVDFMRQTYGLHPQAQSETATILRAPDQQFAVLADDGNGGVMIIVAGQGMQDAA